MFYLTTHSTHFIYGYMTSHHSNSEREKTCCSHMGYSFRLAARVLLYASSHRQDNTYHGLCYTSRGALAGTRNSSMGPLWRIDPTTHCVMSERSYHGTTLFDKGGFLNVLVSGMCQFPECASFPNVRVSSMCEFPECASFLNVPVSGMSWIYICIIYHDT